MTEPMDVVCEGCGVTFVLSEFAHSRRESLEPEQRPPLLCSLCRAERRQTRAQEASGETKFTGDPNEYRSPMDVRAPDGPARRGRRRSVRRGDQGASDGAKHREGERPRRRRRRNAGGSRVLYPAVCAKCGASTHVPFQPSKWQPVYCRACYADLRAGTPGESSDQS